jgi:uncharacterized membrane protein YoaK (UPF0700 family)
MTTSGAPELTRPPIDAGVRPAGRRLSPTTIRDLLLVVLTMSSGAVDAISFIGLGRVFTAFMSGNLVYLGMGIANAGGPGFIRAMVSLAAFAVGAFLAARILEPSMGSRALWSPRVSITLGVASLSQAAFLAVWLATAGHSQHGAVEILVALSAFAMGLQTGAVLSLGVTGVFTTAATATLLYLVTDVADWSLPAENRVAVERARAKQLERRRVAAVLAGLIAGAAGASAMLMGGARNYAPLVPLVLTALVIAIASVVLSGQPKE